MCGHMRKCYDLLNMPDFPFLHVTLVTSWYMHVAGMTCASLVCLLHDRKCIWGEMSLHKFWHALRGGQVLGNGLILNT